MVAIGPNSTWYVYFPQQNHEGSVTLLTNTTGAVIERYRYDAFGAPSIYDLNWNVRANTIYDNRFLFTGREYAATYRSTYNTAAFNFYEYRSRADNPILGRFMPVSYYIPLVAGGTGFNWLLEQRRIV